MFRYLDNDELQKVANVSSMWHSAAYCATSWKEREIQLEVVDEDMLLNLAQLRVQHVSLKNDIVTGHKFAL